MLQDTSTIPGWCWRQKAVALYDLVLLSDSQFTFEMGVFGGSSLIPMALAHKKKGSGFIIGADAWSKAAALDGKNTPENDAWWGKLDYPAIHKGCIDTITQYGCDDFCSVIKMNSLTIGKLFPDESIDIIHCDSNHCEDIAFPELELYFPKLKPGGFWVADDIAWETMKSTVAKLHEMFDVVDEYTSTFAVDGNSFGVYQKR